MLLELQNIKKKFAAPETEVEIPVLKGVNLTVAEGEKIAVVGPSGSGKSTLLHLIGTLDRPTEGTILFDGILIADLSDTERTQMRNQEIGYIFQLHHLLPQCTVLENVLMWFPTKTTGLSVRVILKRPLIWNRPPQSSRDLKTMKEDFAQSSRVKLPNFAIGQTRKTV